MPKMVRLAGILYGTAFDIYRCRTTALHALRGSVTLPRMNDSLSHFVVLFTVLDPLGVAAVFSAVTRDVDAAVQRTMAIRGVALAGMILLTFFFVGDDFLHLLNITIPAFRIAGGLLLFLLAVDMVFARPSGMRTTTAREHQEAERKRDISVFPLAFPLIAGPGAITTVLLMTSDLSWRQPTHALSLLATLLVALLLTLIILLSAARLTRWLGETGVNVVSRLFGLVLSALAVQYVLDGLRAGFHF
jgi:multiple antibiotic resistance protein